MLFKRTGFDLENVLSVAFEVLYICLGLILLIGLEVCGEAFDVVLEMNVHFGAPLECIIVGEMGIRNMGLN